jgi:hypothetical protein
MDWIDLAQDKDQWRPLVNTVMNLLTDRHKYRQHGDVILTYLFTYGAEPFLRSCQLCSYSRTSQHFMEPEGSMRIYTSTPPYAFMA